MTDLYTILIVVAVAVLGTICIPKLKFKKENLDAAEKTLNVVDLILEVIDIDEANKNKTKFVLDLAQTAVDFISALSVDDANKKDISMEVISKVLTKLNVSLTESEYRLVKIVVDECLNFAEKQ